MFILNLIDLKLSLRNLQFTIILQCNLCRADIIGAKNSCPSYRDVHVIQTLFDRFCFRMHQSDFSGLFDKRMFCFVARELKQLKVAESD